MLRTYRLATTFPMVHTKRVQTEDYYEAYELAKDYACEIQRQNPIATFGMDIYRVYNGSDRHGQTNEVYVYTIPANVVMGLTIQRFDIADGDSHINVTDVHEPGEWPAR